MHCYMLNTHWANHPAAFSWKHIVYGSREVLHLQTRKLSPHPGLRGPQGRGGFPASFFLSMWAPNANIHHLGDRYCTRVSSHYSPCGSRRLSEELELKWDQSRAALALGDGSIGLTMALPGPGLRKQARRPCTEQLVLVLRVLTGLHASPNIDAFRNVFLFTGGSSSPNTSPTHIHQLLASHLWYSAQLSSQENSSFHITGPPSGFFHTLCTPLPMGQ